MRAKKGTTASGGKYGYSVLIRRNGGESFSGFYRDIGYARKNASLEGGQVIRFSRNKDGGFTMQDPSKKRCYTIPRARK